jgi:hypothetical protein
MAENVYEQLVETYLAMDTGLFLNPQYSVCDSKWEACVDFLAICFREKTAWMVEVTRGYGRLNSKIAEFGRDYEPRIRAQLISDKVIFKGVADDWKIGFWAFVPEDECKNIQTRLEQAGVWPRKVEPLETVLSLKAGDHRFAKNSN